eukprot:SAG25_NODE_892_length_4894_cov_8.055892_7_plen_85_part_00
MPSRCAEHVLCVPRGVQASDGVWDHLDNRAVVEIVDRHIKSGEGRQVGGAPKAAEALADAARRQWAVHGGGYVDDITALVVKLQ